MAASSKALAVRSPAQQEREFLPAALEIMEAPASPIGRAIGGVIILLVLSALAWAVFGKVEIVATASGRVVPSGRSKVIQPLEGGIVRAIHVQNGDVVRAGDVLIDLDPTESTADRNRLAGELMQARLETARLRALLSDNRDPQNAFAAPPEADAGQIALHRQLIESALAEYNAKMSELDRQVAREQANRDAVMANIQKIETVLPLLREQLEMRRTLFERNVGSKLSYLEAEERVVEMERELSVQQSRAKEADSAAAAVLESRRKAEAEQRSGWLTALSEAQTKVSGLTQDLIKADQHRREQVLAAPVDGVVQQLAVHTVGGVVRPADTLLVLVPTDSLLEVEAVIVRPCRSGGEGQGRQLSLHEIWPDQWPSPQRFVRFNAVSKRSRGERRHGAARPRTCLHGTGSAGPQFHHGRQPGVEAQGRNGGYGRDRHWRSADHRVPALAFGPTCAGEHAGAVKRLKQPC